LTDCFVGTEGKLSLLAMTEIGNNMTTEEQIQQDLLKKFGFLEGQVRVQRARRIFVTVPYENFKPVFDHIRNDLGFSILCTITGLDETPVFSLMYHMARREGIMLNLKTSVPRENPVIKTVTPYFPDADIYEREVEDLFGMKIEGLAPGKRYPLPDDWPAGQYPLRKDWKVPQKKESGQNEKA
jgi:membrane-bound hydrogenase subunit beta